MATKNVNYEEYLEGNSWKCPEAPIDRKYPVQDKYDVGAHYWKTLEGNKYYCKYCYEIRVFPETMRDLERDYLNKPKPKKFVNHESGKCELINVVKPYKRKAKKLSGR